jgi:raffinose/stachyose/melibiose transport system permease protein
VSRRGPGVPRRVAYLYILPALLIFVPVVVVPLAQTAWLSLFRWDGLREPVWVGLRNYLDLAADSGVIDAFVHAAELVAFYSWLPVGLGLLLVTFLTRRSIRGMTVFRTLLFLPQIVPVVVLAVTWRWIYSSDGLINSTLSAVGLAGLSRLWLADFDTALPALGLVGAWVMYGLCLVLFIAGVQKIPRELYDAARVDGAGILAEFRAVTMPGLRNELVVAVTITTIAGLRAFDLVYVATKGGPGHATTVPTLVLFQRAFVTGQAGSAAAIAIVLAAVVFLAAFLIIRLAEDRGR